MKSPKSEYLIQSLDIIMDLIRHFNILIITYVKMDKCGSGVNDVCGFNIEFTKKLVSFLVKINIHIFHDFNYFNLPENNISEYPTKISFIIGFGNSSGSILIQKELP